MQKVLFPLALLFSLCSCVTEDGILTINDLDRHPNPEGSTYVGFRHGTPSHKREGGVTTIYNLQTGREYRLYFQDNDMETGEFTVASYYKLSLPPGPYAVVEYEFYLLNGTSTNQVIFSLEPYEAPWFFIPKKDTVFYGHLVFTSNSVIRGDYKTRDFDELLKEKELSFPYREEKFIFEKNEKQKIKEQYKLDNIDL